MPLTRAMAAAQSRPKDNHVAQAGRTPKDGLVTDPPPRKRARATKSIAQGPKRAKKTSLGRLMDLPPELFNEIAIHLFPADLLSLARSNKFFRKMFMSRTSERFWKQALINAPHIPACPKELSEPQYVSLLFSKTCSSCGVRVLRRMDPYLYVRLCTTCRDEEVVEVYLLDDLIPILPISDVIKEPRFGHAYTLRSELLKITAEAKRNREKKDTTYIEWREARISEIEERQAHSEEIEEYLDWVEETREIELEELKAHCRDQIEARLLEKGWTKQHLKPAPNNATRWFSLVSQPKPLTDRIWNNLYPKLMPLLESNRIYNDQLDKENRRRDRIKKLQGLTSSIRTALPPLVHIIRKADPNNESSTSSTSAPTTRNSETKIEPPFPSTNELLAWPMIKSIVEEDISPEEFEAKFHEIGDEFDRAVLDWRDKIERELVAIWDAGQEDKAKPEASASKGKGKAAVRTTRSNARKSRRATGASATSNSSESRSVELELPEFIVTFTKPDGTPTTNITDLPPNLQLLLRADTMFKSADGFILNRTYPAIVPRAVPLGLIMGGPEELNYGDRWDGSRFRRDSETSTVAKELLVRVGRSDATAVEMRELGVNFTCGRCNLTLTDTWEDLVYHFSVEQSRHKQAQERIKAEPEREFVFHNTHGFGPGNSKPFAQLLTPREAAEYNFQDSLRHSHMMVCIKCQEMGIQGARYFHEFALGLESPIIEHLHDVHDVTGAKLGLHFEGWDGVDFFDVSESDEEYDSEEE